jgi:hypothetical protein
MKHDEKTGDKPPGRRAEPNNNGPADRQHRKYPQYEICRIPADAVEPIGTGNRRQSGHGEHAPGLRSDCHATSDCDHARDKDEREQPRSDRKEADERNRD